MEKRMCVFFDDEECIECGDCGIYGKCDLDSEKTCDNCGKCIGLDNTVEYRVIMVDGVFTEEPDKDSILYKQLAKRNLLEPPQKKEKEIEWP